MYGYGTIISSMTETGWKSLFHSAIATVMRETDGRPYRDNDANCQRSRVTAGNKEEFAARQAERRARPSVPEQPLKVAENTETKAETPIAPTAPEFVRSAVSCAMQPQPSEASQMPDTRRSDPPNAAPEALRAA